MDHLIARVKSASKKETLKLKKVLSNQTIFENDAFELMPYVSYDPDHNLDSDTWFCIVLKVTSYGTIILPSGISP